MKMIANGEEINKRSGGVRTIKRSQRQPDHSLCPDSAGVQSSVRTETVGEGPRPAGSDLSHPVATCLASRLWCLTRSLVVACRPSFALNPRRGHSCQIQTWMQNYCYRYTAPQMGC